MKKLHILLLCIASLCILTSCVQDMPVENEDIPVGVITALSGQNALQGEWTRKGLELAKDHINAEGGVHGLNITLLYEDSEYRPVTALSAAKRLIESEEVKFIITQSGASSTLAIAPYATGRDVVQVEILCIVKACQTENDMLYRVSGPPDDQLKHILGYMKTQNMNTASILYINNDYGSYQHDLFSDLFEGTILASEVFEQGATDLRTQIVKASEDNPDVIVIISYPREAAVFLKQQGELELGIPTIGTITSENQQMLDIAGAHANDHVYTYFTTNFKEGLGKRYRDEYVARHSEEPELFGAKSYDALLVLKTAMETCADPTDSVCVGNAILSIENLQGISDVLTFSKYGDLTQERFEIKTIQNGSFMRIN